MSNSKLKNIGLITLSIVCILLFIRTCNEKDTIKVDVPVKIEVPVPVVEKQFDTIYVPQPYQVKVKNPINKTLSDKLVKSNSTIDSLLIYKNFSVKNNYKEIFEDDIQIITVTAETTGSLDNLQASYKTKPRTVKLDTIIRTEIKIPVKTKFGLGMEIGIPLERAKEAYYNGSTTVITQSDILYKLNLELDSKKIIYKVGIDSDKRLWTGATYKF